MAGSQQKKNNEWVIWALIVLLFAMDLSPIALILLLYKLFGKDKNEQTEQAAAHGGRTVEKRPAAKWLKLIGAFLVAVGTATSYQPLEKMFRLGKTSGSNLVDVLMSLAAVMIGVVMIAGGLSMDRQFRRYVKYLAVLGDRDAMPVDEMARTLGYSTWRVEKDLQKMLDRGYFGDKAYLNKELGCLFRSEQADVDFQKAQQAAKKDAPPKEAEEGYSGILRSIRRANDAIADPVLSAKIDRLEEITAKIFRAVEEDPKKRDKINTFLDYYLPTTQKLLRSYAEFESAGVEGENLGQAKQRIENTMDAIVRGFEHQLDELYKADALDVDSDIRVMETMLRRDTATVAQDFGLEGAAVQQEETK